jgi:hypothetical protein
LRDALRPAVRRSKLRAYWFLHNHILVNRFPTPAEQPGDARFQLQQRVLTGPAHRDPATTRLQLLDKRHEFFSGHLLKDRTGDVDDVGLKNLHKREVLQPELHAVTQGQARADLARNAMVSG